jgi:vacuolar-type H+-ATPase subunit I/STV1
MPDSPDQPNLDAALLRAEQNFFEQAQEQSQQLTALHDQLEEREHTIQILKSQLAQAQEEIGTANGRLEHLLATQVNPIAVAQLAQAQEELEHALRQLDALQKWQYLTRTNIKLLLKLLTKALLLGLFNRLRWLVPLQGARRIKSLLCHLKQGLSVLRH